MPRTFATVLAESEADWLSDRQVAWYARISASHSDVRAALDRLIERTPLPPSKWPAGRACSGPAADISTNPATILNASWLSTRPRALPHPSALGLGITLTLQGDHHIALRIGEECADAARQDDTRSPNSSPPTPSASPTSWRAAPGRVRRQPPALTNHSTSPPSGAPQLCCMVIRTFAQSALGRLAEAYEAAIDLRDLSLGTANSGRGRTRSSNSPS